MFPKEFLKHVLSPYIKENKGIVISLLITTLVIFILITILLPIIYTFFSVNVNTLPLSGNLFTLNNSSSYFFILAIILIILIVLEKIRNSCEHKINIDFVNHFRKRLVHNLIIKYKHNFEEPNIGNIIPRMISLTQDSLRYVEYIIRINQYLLALLLISVASFFFSKSLGFLFLVYTILYIFLTYYRFFKPLKKNIEVPKSLYRTIEYLTDSCSNLLNVYINNQEQDVISKNFEKFNDHDRKLKVVDSIQGKKLSLILIIQLLFTVTFFFLLYLLFSHNKISKLSTSTLIILLITSFSLSVNIYERFTLLTLQTGSIYESKDFLNSFFNIEDNSLREKKNIKIIGDIIFKNIYFKYPKGENYILNNLSFSVSNGQRLGILGRSGSGKTTVMKLLIKLYSINSGTILIDGKNIDTFNVENLRKSINYINQKTTLYNDSILYNIQYGNNQSKEKILELIDKYQINVFDSLTNGIDTNAGLLGGKISLGMQKIIILLRGILRDGNIIIFDEPLTSLDPNTRKKVLKMIKEECKDKTVLVITHDMEIIPYMDKIIDINEINNQFS